MNELSVSSWGGDIFLSEDVPLTQKTFPAYVEFIKEYRYLHGIKSARELWEHLPFPKPYDDRTVPDFIHYFTEDAPGKSVPAWVMHDAYQVWCRMNAEQPESLEDFEQKARQWGAVKSSGPDEVFLNVQLVGLVEDNYAHIRDWSVNNAKS